MVNEKPIRWDLIIGIIVILSFIFVIVPTHDSTTPTEVRYVYVETTPEPMPTHNTYVAPTPRSTPIRNTYVAPKSVTLSTEHVSGIDQNVIVSHCSTLHVSGIDNIVRVTNDDVRRVYVSGIDNTVYIPSSSNPITSISGVDCIIIRY